MRQAGAKVRVYSVLALLMAAALLVGLSGCDEGDPKAKAKDKSPGDASVVFQVYDHNYAPVSGASVYLDADTVPAATTDSTGRVSLDLDGIHDVHIHKSGYGARSYVNRDWNGVTTQQTVRLPIYLATPGIGSINGGISPTSTSDPVYRARAVRLDDGFNLVGPNTPGVTSTTPYVTSAFLGSNEFFLYPAAANTSSSVAYAAYTGPITVTGVGAVVNYTPTVGGGTTFTMAGTSGIPGGTMNSSYVVSRDPFSISQLISNSTAPQPATTLSGDMLTVPPVDSVYPGVSFQLLVNSQTAVTGARPQRSWMQIYRTHADLIAAPLSQSYALPDFGLAILTPGDLTVNTGTTPTIMWNMTGAPQFTEILFQRYIAAFPGYVEIVWQAWVYGQTSVTYPPVLPPLLTDAAYAYNLQGRSNHLDSAGQYSGFERDGYQIIRFGTGPTTPP